MNLEPLAAGAGLAAAASAAFNTLALVRRGLAQRRRPAALALALLSAAVSVQGALWAAGPAGPLGVWPAALPALRAGAALGLAAGSLLVSTLLLRRAVSLPKGPSLLGRFSRWLR